MLVIHFEMFTRFSFADFSLIFNSKTCLNCLFSAKWEKPSLVCNVFLVFDA